MMEGIYQYKCRNKIDKDFISKYFKLDIESRLNLEDDIILYTVTKTAMRKVKLLSIAKEIDNKLLSYIIKNSSHSTAYEQIEKILVDELAKEINNQIILDLRKLANI